MDNSITVYGIANCDTVKKARAWLAERGIGHVFHDFRKQGVPEERLDRWLASAGWQALVNRKGTTWRNLDRQAQDCIVDAASARILALQQPSVIRRPVVEWDSQTTVGFDPDAWERIRPKQV